MVGKRERSSENFSSKNYFRKKESRRGKKKRRARISKFLKWLVDHRSSVKYRVVILRCEIGIQKEFYSILSEAKKKKHRKKYQKPSKIKSNHFLKLSIIYNL